MSTLSQREAALRRALQSAAASIEPAPDGLERIQARLRRPRPVVVASLEAAWTDIYLRAQPVVVGWLEAARTELYPRARDAARTAVPVVAEGVRRVCARFAPTSEPGRALPVRWLRPLAAMSLAIFVIGGGIYVGLSGSVFPAGNSQNSGIVSPGGSGAGGQGNQGPAGSGTPIGQSGQPHSSPTPSACTKTPKPSYRPMPSSSATSGSPTPSGSTTPTGSPSPSPTPSPSTSSSTTPNPAGTTSAIGVGAAATGQHSSTAILRAAAVTGASAAKATTASASSRRHRTAKPSPSPTPTPCPSRTTVAAGPPALQWPQAGGASSLASVHLTAAGLAPTVAAARLNRNFAV